MQKTESNYSNTDLEEKCEGQRFVTDAKTKNLLHRCEDKISHSHAHKGVISQTDAKKNLAKNWQNSPETKNKNNMNKNARPAQGRKSQNNARREQTEH